MIYWFSSHISSSSLEVFYWLISLFGFLPQFLITGLGGFLPAIWYSFETYQLLYGARIFLLVPWFSSSISIIGLGDFLPSSYSSSPWMIPCSAELASEKRSNCNNMIFGAESSQSRSHVTITKHDFTSSGLTSITTLGSSSSTLQSRRYVYLQVRKIFHWTHIRYDKSW